MRAVTRYIRGDYGLESIVWVEYVLLCTQRLLRPPLHHGDSAWVFVGELLDMGRDGADPVTVGGKGALGDSLRHGALDSLGGGQ